MSIEYEKIAPKQIEELGCGSERGRKRQIFFDHTDERGEDDNELQIISTQLPATKKKAGRSRKITMKEEDEEEESRKNWPNCEVETLIAIRGETEPGFVKNAKKQGMSCYDFSESNGLFGRMRGC